MDDYPFLTLSKIILYILSAAVFALSVILLIPALETQELLGTEIPRNLFLLLTVGTLGHSILLAGAAELIKLFQTTAENIQTMTDQSAESLELLRKIEITAKYAGKGLVRQSKERSP